MPRTPSYADHVRAIQATRGDKEGVPIGHRRDVRRLAVDLANALVVLAGWHASTTGAPGDSFTTPPLLFSPHLAQTSPPCEAPATLDVCGADRKRVYHDDVLDALCELLRWHGFGVGGVRVSPSRNGVTRRRLVLTWTSIDNATDVLGKQ